MSSSDDRDTNPDFRSPYECVLDELKEIKALCRDTNQVCTNRIDAIERWQLVTLLASFAGFMLGACAFIK